MKRQHKIIFALLIAAFGIVLAWRTIGRSSRPVASQPPVAEAPPEVRREIDQLRIDTSPTADTAQSISAEAASRVSELLGNGDAMGSVRLSNEQAADLPVAFGERIFALACGDFDAITSALAERGLNLPTDEAARERWRKGRAWLGSPPNLGLEQVQLVSVYEHGNRLAPDPIEVGWNTFSLRYEQSMMPVSLDPESAGLTVVEVRLPMTHKSVKSGETTVLPTGFRFAWDESQSRWVPWEILTYKDKEDPQPYVGVVFR